MNLPISRSRSWESPSGNILNIDDTDVIILGCIGSGAISRAIQRLTNKHDTKELDRWTHVAMLMLDEKSEPWVYESHFKTRGCIRISFRKWLEQQSENGVKVFAKSFETNRPYRFGRAEACVDLKIPYGTTDLKDAALPKWANLVKFDGRGMHCSEFADFVFDGWASKPLHIQSFEVAPVDWQFIANSGVPIVEITGLKV